ncbi:peptide deformylase [Lonsdalea quercina]|uniref:peptide deformylase n=1 Tax=Lonsdalea quercina TaxID=71657 RepID=UPI003976C095
MSANELVWIDDPRMKTVSRHVEVIDDSVNALVERMFALVESMNDSGLAAIQLGIPQRIVVIDMDDEQGTRQRLALINPEVVERSQETTSHLELCSSIPQHPLPAERAKRVRVAYTDRDGNPQSLEAGGALAVCLQHEIDHLDGLSLIDNLSDLKRNRIRTQLAKLRRKLAPRGE